MSILNEAACNDIIFVPTEVETPPCCGCIVIWPVRDGPSISHIMYQHGLRERSPAIGLPWALLFFEAYVRAVMRWGRC